MVVVAVSLLPVGIPFERDLPASLPHSFQHARSAFARATVSGKANPLHGFSGKRIQSHSREKPNPSPRNEQLLASYRAESRSRNSIFGSTLAGDCYGSGNARCKPKRVNGPGEQDAAPTALINLTHTQRERMKDNRERENDLRLSTNYKEILWNSSAPLLLR